MKGPYSRNIRENTTTYTVPMHYRDVVWYRTTGPSRTPLPYEVTDGRVDFSTFPAGYTGVSVTQASQYCTSARGSHPLCPVSLAEVNNKAYAKFVQKMNDPIGLGTDIAEYAETFRMVKDLGTAARHPFETFARSFKAFNRAVKRSKWAKKGKSDPSLKDIISGGSKDLSKAASSLWLQFHFGVQPLYQDFFDILKLDPKVTDQEYDVEAASSKVTECTSRGYKTVEQYIFRLGVRYAATIRIKDENAALRESLGIQSPAAIAWELVPYSFLIDWFYPVSQYVNSATDFHGREIVTGYKSTRSRGVCNYTNNWTSPSKGFTAGGFHFSRTVGPAAYPTMVLQPLRLPDKLSAVRTVTALALIFQRVL